VAKTIEEIRKSKREHMARRRKENPEAVRAYQRQQHAKNREKNKEKMREYYAKRFFWGRAMKLRGENRATAKELAFLWKNQLGLCALTGRKLNRENAQLDHITAKAKGGKDNIENLRWTCKEANLAKRELTDDEFVELCENVMRWIGQRINKKTDHL
jgi:5-methylcytosine-specific restriction endonuclease McrA